MRRIAISEDFQRCDRSRRFLTYIVEETLAGRGERLKAFSVATSALDRDDTFDPQADPLVRIEASQLRRRLERYYLTGGRNDPIVIDLPKGGYVPAFSLRPVQSVPVQSSGSATPPNGRRGVAGVAAMVSVIACLMIGAHAFGGSDRMTEMFGGSSIQILPFTPANDDRSAAIAAGMADELTQALTRQGAVAVFGRGAVEYARDRRPSSVLTGSVRTSAGTVRVTASLVDTANGTYIWTQAYDRPITEPVLETQGAFAASIVENLARAE
ncbi:hypothetical protein N825_22180 [Skermanella stibiiresistens SB22]|uniref:TolB N-terminal domain-containing protein n=1 Tax=Skermanella stibiiresistens SB22 TaxID=1385369 RepID=W9GSZ6_9PROT|nr:hypothetical protein N825_22180 [Skermanella stibiiresistens SB22]